MMRDLTIKFSGTDEEVARFEGRMAMIVAVSEEEAALLRANLNGVHVFLKLVRRGTATLREILETRGSIEPDVAKTLEMLINPAATADELHDQTRELIGRAIFVEAGQSKERLQ
jgi:hypothetical protein